MIFAKWHHHYITLIYHDQVGLKRFLIFPILCVCVLHACVNGVCTHRNPKLMLYACMWSWGGYTHRHLRLTFSAEPGPFTEPGVQ